MAGVSKRDDPRISAPQLGHYLDAKVAGARERIVRNQMFPPLVPPRRYNEAMVEFRSALINGGDVLQRLREGARRISIKPRRKARDEEKRNLCLEAIEHFTKVLPRLPLKGVSAWPINGLALMLEQVRVSVYPVVLLGKRVRGEERRGALLLVTYKTKPLAERGAKAVPTLLYEALAARYGAEGNIKIDPKLCLVVDVFAEAIYTAPDSRTRMMNEIRNECREIARTWRAIQGRAA